MPVAPKAVKQLGLKLPGNSGSYKDFINRTVSIVENRKLLVAIAKSDFDAEYEQVLRKQHPGNESLVAGAMQEV